MNVLVFAKHPQGGIKTYCAYMYGNPALRDIQISLLTPVTDSAVFFREKLGEEIHHVQAGNGNFSLLKHLWRLLVAEKPDILHSHGFTAGILGALPARLLGVRHVVTSHDIFQESQFLGWKGWFKRRVVGALLSLADCINPVGEDARANLVAFYPGIASRDKITPIRNGISVAAFSGSGRRDVRGEAELPQEAVLAGYFGRFMAQKGFRILVDLVDRWNSRPERRPLHVACFGWGGFIREEKRDLQRRNLDQYFHFFDNTDNMLEALRGVDVVVMPSRWEACPLLAMEALTAGAPLIASDCIGNREVTKDTPALVFKSESVEDFDRAMALFINDQDQIVQRAENFREEAAIRFDVDAAAGKLRELYDSMQIATPR